MSIWCLSKIRSLRRTHSSWEWSLRRSLPSTQGLHWCQVDQSPAPHLPPPPQPRRISAARPLSLFYQRHHILVVQGLHQCRVDQSPAPPPPQPRRISVAHLLSLFYQQYHPPSFQPCRPWDQRVAVYCPILPTCPPRIAELPLRALPLQPMHLDPLLPPFMARLLPFMARLPTTAVIMCPQPLRWTPTMNLATTVKEHRPSVPSRML